MIGIGLLWDSLIAYCSLLLPAGLRQEVCSFDSGTAKPSNLYYWFAVEVYQRPYFWYLNHPLLYVCSLNFLIMRSQQWSRSDTMDTLSSPQAIHSRTPCGSSAWRCRKSLEKSPAKSMNSAGSSWPKLLTDNLARRNDAQSVKMPFQMVQCSGDENEPRGKCTSPLAHAKSR